MDRDLEVRTPESISFRYDLAGLGSRFLALVVDQVLQIGILIAVFAAIGFVISRVPATTHGSSGASGDAEKIGAAIGIALVVVLVFAIFFGYFIAFETLWNGQTPGKKALGIRVVRDGGYPVDFGAAAIRNLIRVGEFALGYYLLSAISMLLSTENKRLGDFAAGTVVVRDAHLKLERKPGTENEPAYGSTRYLSGEERGLVKRFLEQRDLLDAGKRRELAGKLASRVRARVPEELQRLDDESLLERL
jgi:uncharacterized RDD family membrane protein YckC